MLAFDDNYQIFMAFTYIARIIMALCIIRLCIPRKTFFIILLILLLYYYFFPDIKFKGKMQLRRVLK